MKRRTLMAVLMSCLILSGCAPQNTPQALSVPVSRHEELAPLVDDGGAYNALASMYLPVKGEEQLGLLTREIRFLGSCHEAETLAASLLAQPGQEEFLPVAGGQRVTLNSEDAVTVSMEVATVNLSVEALALSSEAFYLLCQAIANTLCETENISGVNILVSGVSPGLDVAATLPMGMMLKNTLDAPQSRYARLVSQRTAAAITPFSTDVALYFPDVSGRGVLAQGQTLSFSSTEISSMVYVLLDALSQGAEDLPNALHIENLSEMLFSPVMLQETPQRTVLLGFGAELNEALSAARIPRDTFIASLVMTLTTFLPNVPAVAITIGNEKIETLKRSTFERANEETVFQNGFMRREDFRDYLLTDVPLYFVDNEGVLHQTLRALPQRIALSPRLLFSQLTHGALPGDKGKGLLSALPQGVGASQLIAFSRAGETLCLNFTEEFRALFDGVDEQQEKNAIYAIVNTMTHLPAVSRVRIYIEGAQPDYLAASIYLPGDFMRYYAP